MTRMSSMSHRPAASAHLPLSSIEYVWRLGKIKRYPSFRQPSFPQKMFDDLGFQLGQDDGPDWWGNFIRSYPHGHNNQPSCKL